MMYDHAIDDLGSLDRPDERMTIFCSRDRLIAMIWELLSEIVFTAILELDGLELFDRFWGTIVVEYGLISCLPRRTICISESLISSPLSSCDDIEPDRCPDSIEPVTPTDLISYREDIITLYMDLGRIEWISGTDLISQLSRSPPPYHGCSKDSMASLSLTDLIIQTSLPHIIDMIPTDADIDRTHSIWIYP